MFVICATRLPGEAPLVTTTTFPAAARADASREGDLPVEQRIGTPRIRAVLGLRRCPAVGMAVYHGVWC